MTVPSSIARPDLPSNQSGPGTSGQNPDFPPFCPVFCPACGAAFQGCCRYCGLTLTGVSALPTPAPQVMDGQISLPFSALAAAADPLAALTSWRQALPPGGRLQLLAADRATNRWITPKRALMQLIERAGFRLVGRGWLRKTWLFRRY